MQDTNETDPDPTESNMGFLDHLEELRLTLVKCSAVFIIAIVIVSFFLSDITHILLQPMANAMGSMEEARNVLRTSRPMGIFSVFLQVVFFGALGLSLPFILWIFSSFVAPALTPSEKKVIFPTCLFATILFMLGIALSYFIILPLSLSFSIYWNEKLGLIPLWGASSYYGLVVWLSLAIGGSFEFPLLIVILTYMGIVPVKKLKDSRKIVFVGMMIFSALITPGGDPISLSCTAGLMYALYELSIIISVWLISKKKEPLHDYYSDNS